MTEQLKITVYGAGYVGLITACCLADVGYSVCCMDVDADKIAACNAGQPPIFEEGLSELLARVLEKNAITFTTDLKTAVDFGDIQFVAVGTPPGELGEADLSALWKVLENIAEHIDHSAVIVIKSTVPVGTTEQCRDFINDKLNGPQSDFTVSVASNPEFLREGVSIADFMEPDRVVVGVDDEFARNKLQQLYTHFLPAEKIVMMDPRSSEMTKYAANAMLATKISFINEMSQIAARLGADIESVRDGIGRDHRIGPYFISPGCGYGGSCFPKDVSALLYQARDLGYQPRLLTEVREVNEVQKQLLFQKISTFFNDDCANKVVALWGLSFKPGTDDIRDAPSLTLIEQLIEANAMVKVFDPAAMDNMKQRFAEQSNVIFCDSKEECLQNADVLALLTEWPEFCEPDFEQIKSTLREPAIFDGRNVYDPAAVKSAGIAYYPIGRGYDELNR
jgi:UDPglucose 6-dehydrogenase